MSRTTAFVKWGSSSLVLAASACGALDEVDKPSRLEDGSELAALDLIADSEPSAADGRTEDYTEFEADPVRPVAVLEQSGWVAVANTPDDSVVLVRPTDAGAQPCNAVKVGMRPVAVGVVRESRSLAELWVVNHLSDSVSIVHVNLDDCRGEVTRTLAVGDEPRDLVVATRSDGARRVFVTTAHRGQHHPTEGARLGTDLVTAPNDKEQRGLADVLVFDPEAIDTPPAAVNLFADTPRALAVGDGVVYAASFKSGNRTTAIGGETVTERGRLSLEALLARDAAGQPIEADGELVLRPEAVGQVAIEGGMPAVAGQGRCFADPREEPGEALLARVCVETDEQNRAVRARIAQPGVADAACQCTSGDGTLQPLTGVIVKFFDQEAECGAAFTTFPDGSRGCWLDRAPAPGPSPALAARAPRPMEWNDEVRLTLPDEDVFAIAVDDLSVTKSFSGVGTILFDMAVQPGTGKLFVTNTDANNLARFEGHGSASSSTVIGHLHESRVTVIDPEAAGALAVQPVHLNSHIDYGRCCERDPQENDRSFAFPTAGAFSADGQRFYFSALGSDKIGFVSADAVGPGFDQQALRERGALGEIWLSDAVDAPAGPVGLALDAERGRLYVKTHFSNELVVIDTQRDVISSRWRLPTPEPRRLTAGRSVLYNARLTSSHGDSACASCHVFGDFDGLSWDLGDPEGSTVTNPGPFASIGLDDPNFRSNKGPMNTQTLRGMANHGALHWRGDRTRRFTERAGEQPDTGSLDEVNSFGEFDVAIRGLNGNDELLDPAVFARFTDFALGLVLPPNPNRHLDDTLTADQAAARAMYFGCQSMTDEQFRAHQCVAHDGRLVEIDAETRACTCANNPLLPSLRDSGTALSFAQLMQGLLADEGFRARFDALVRDESGLSDAAAERLRGAVAAIEQGADELAAADASGLEAGLLSPELTSAVSALAFGLGDAIDVSVEQGTASAESLRALLAESIDPTTLPPEASLDSVEVLRGEIGTVLDIAGTTQLVLSDEQARGTSGFRNLMSGCDVTEEPRCALRATDGIETCNGCHTLDPNGNAEAGVAHPGFFGTSGGYAFDGESQVFKVPHLRNTYQKIGMFGMAPDPFFLTETAFGAEKGGFFTSTHEFTGPQVRGYGFFHDGVTDTLHRFFGATGFVSFDGDNPGGFDPFLPRADDRPACVQVFRQATPESFALAPEAVQPFLDLCVASGPLPESCFLEPDAPECRSALEAAAIERDQDFLPDSFAAGIVQVCYQLGSALEQGAPDGVCYPSGLREREQMESFVLAFDTNLAPMVGQQLSLEPSALADLALGELLAVARRGDCDLALRQQNRGYLVTEPHPTSPPSTRLESRTGASLALEDLSERRGAITFTCYPPRPDHAEARREAFGRR